MTKANFRPIRCLVFVVLLFSPVSAMGDEMVWDPEEIARLSQTTARMAEASSYAAELLRDLDAMARTIGRAGSLSTLDLARFAANGGLAMSPPEDAVGKLTASLAGGNPTSRTEQRQHVLDTLYEAAVEEGVALAMVSRQHVGNATWHARNLVAEASSAVDLRSDVAANTATAVALLGQMVDLEAILASIIEVQAIGTLRSIYPTPAVKR